LVCDQVESPRETYVRLLLVLAGLPQPECNVDLGSDHSYVSRADLVYLRYALIIEYDGRDHAAVVTQWNRDLDRLDEFEDARWGHVRVTAHRLKRPRDVVARVHAKLVGPRVPGTGTVNRAAVGGDVRGPLSRPASRRVCPAGIVALHWRDFDHRTR
jgi:hypothetical protein